jgi:hypothetical protein
VTPRPTSRAAKKLGGFGEPTERNRKYRFGDNETPADRRVYPRRGDVPKCKSTCPQRSNPGVSIHLSSFAMSSSLFRDASEGAEMPSRLVSRSSAAAMAGPRAPLLARDMTRMEFIMLAAGWSTAFVAVFIRFIGH